jgi:hypothetical protein
MPYSLYTGYCHIDLERFRNGSGSFVSNTITTQAAKYNMQHTTYIIITVQSIISTGFIGRHTHSISIIVAFNSSASAMARAPSSPILFLLKLYDIFVYTLQLRYNIITARSITHTQDSVDVILTLYWLLLC